MESMEEPQRVASEARWITGSPPPARSSAPAGSAYTARARLRGTLPPGTYPVMARPCSLMRRLLVRSHQPGRSSLEEVIPEHIVERPLEVEHVGEGDVPHREVRKVGVGVAERAVLVMGAWGPEMSDRKRLNVLMSVSASPITGPAAVLSRPPPMRFVSPKRKSPMMPSPPPWARPASAMVWARADCAAGGPAP